MPCFLVHIYRKMAPDGNCLFRAVADQVYGDAELHVGTRQMCVDYIEAERDHFSQVILMSRLCALTVILMSRLCALTVTLMSRL
jgi:hypothetical protein